MDQIITWLLDNMKWLFSGIGVAIIVLLLKWPLNHHTIDNGTTKNEENIPKGDVKKATAPHGIAIVDSTINISSGHESDHPKDDEPVSQDAINAYLSALTDELSLWRGLGLGRNIRLEDSYVSHFISSDPEVKEAITDTEILHRVLNGTLESQNALIEGPAGSGKTTLLKHWASALAERPCKVASREYIPIFLSLGMVAQWCDRNASWDIPLIELVAKLFQDAAGQAPTSLSASLAGAINSGNSIILLDAADEVSEEARYNIKRWLEKVRRSARKCPIVMTSRPCEYILGMESFNVVYMRSFNPKQREDFISTWFQNIGQAEKAPILEEHLKNSLKLNVPEIAGNPLFLTMMCIEFEVTGKLSPTQGALLDQFTRILLEYWDRQQVRNRTKLPLALKLRVLESVASHFFELSYLKFAERELMNYVEAFLKKLNSKVNANKVIKEIEEGSGLLVSDRHGYYQFYHPLFQEFFVARDRVERSRKGEDQHQWIRNSYFNPRFENVMQFFKELKYEMV